MTIKPQNYQDSKQTSRHLNLSDFTYPDVLFSSFSLTIFGILALFLNQMKPFPFVLCTLVASDPECK